MKNEFNQLQEVIVATPQYMCITDIINEVQKQYAMENINQMLATKQHQAFLNVLEKENVHVLKLENDPSLNEQVFTRDIGFVIDNVLFVSHMREQVRKGETMKLISFLNKIKHSYICFENHIEGGDIIVHGDIIYVGISGRTSYEVVLELEEKTTGKQIIPIALKKDILHLDCVFNIIDDEYALLYPEGIEEKSLSNIINHFNYITVKKDEQEKMGTNVLAIDKKTLITMPTQKRINSELRKKGFHLIEQDFSEIIKSGGSFRCCTLPLKRMK